jgi:hypothetical protein
MRGDLRVFGAEGQCSVRDPKEPRNVMGFAYYVSGSIRGATTIS